MSPPLLPGVRHIAIIRLSSMGDVVMAMPAVEGIRAAYPKAHICWIVERRCAAILKGFPAVDEILLFPRDELRGFLKAPWRSLSGLPAIRRFLRQLHNRRFDLSFDFQGNLKSGACSLLAGATLRLGYGRDQCREPNWLFSNRRLHLFGQELHRMERDLLLAGLAGVPFHWRAPRIAFDDTDREVGQRFIPRPHQGAKVVLLHPGSSNFMPHKRWPIERYAALGDRLAELLAARVVLSWGPGERERVERLIGLMQRPAELLPDTPSIKSLGFLMTRADLVVGGDTGPVHLAVALEIPTLVILGPGDPRHYYPLRHPERVFYRKMPCSPCRQRGCQDLSCLKGVTVSEVAEEAGRVLCPAL